MTPWILASSQDRTATSGDALELFALGVALALPLALLLLKDPPSGLMRENFRGARLPVVLGVALSAAAGLALAWGELSGTASLRAGVFEAGLLIALGLGGAGLWDDLRGDERPRGFAGHLGALKGGKVTGGLVKLLVGGIVGLAAAWSFGRGDIVSTVLGGAAIALTANLVNLFDRAPGRAAKISVLGLGLMAAFTTPAWLVLSSCMFGPLAAVAWFDLRERGMLGDAGANPVGGMLGLGVVTFPRFGQVLAVAVLLALNLASERWSFSAIIQRTPILRALDRAGRRP